MKENILSKYNTPKFFTPSIFSVLVKTSTACFTVKKYLDKTEVVIKNYTKSDVKKVEKDMIN